ncbi:MAG: hypothetical protein ACKO0Z_19520 [Betaproteobacteria bacterium]
MSNAFTIPKQSIFGKSAAMDRKIAGSRRGGTIRAATMDIVTATYLNRKPCPLIPSPAKSTDRSKSSTR